MARIETKPRSFTVRILALVLALLLPSLSILSARPALALQENIPLPLPWAADLPVYDHIVIIVEENKDYEQIICRGASQRGKLFLALFGQQSARRIYRQRAGPRFCNQQFGRGVDPRRPFF